MSIGTAPAWALGFALVCGGLTVFVLAAFRAFIACLSPFALTVIAGRLESGKRIWQIALSQHIKKETNMG